MEMVFSFLVNTWQGLPEVKQWAQEHIGASDVLLTKLKREEQILCALEKQRFLAYDGQWKKREYLRVPQACRLPADKNAGFDHVEFRSQTLPPHHAQASWDQKVDVRVRGLYEFTLFTRQDKRYIGAHSTAGWSMWVERKTGHLRYELADPDEKAHFRLHARAIINPVKGILSDIASMEALYVTQKEGQVHKALWLSGNSREGFRHVAYHRQEGALQKMVDKCLRGRTCKDHPAAALDEGKLTAFSNVHSGSYTTYMKEGLPLAFSGVQVEEVVPSVGVFR
ncbi:MAG: hypothetical protein AAGB31_03575 [Bdellovibrio sp.]